MRVFLQTCLVTFAVAFAVAMISGCSVYKSNGRNNFESKAGDNLQSGNVGRSFAQSGETKTTCWTQPKSDPLWQVSESNEMLIHSLNNELIEVCVDPESELSETE